MRKIILFALVLLISISSIYSQKKKDLLDEIEKLRTELTTTKGELTEARKNEKVSVSKVTTIEAQLNDLKETNATLLKATNLQTSQEIIKAKDNQLNAINDAITSNDSINLAVFSKLKNAIGGDNLKINNGTIFIMLPNTTLFGASDKSYIVDSKAKPTLEKIATVLNKETDISIIVEGNSNALKLDGKTLMDNWDLSARQAASVVRVLQIDYEVDPKRMEALGKSEYNTEGIETVTRIIIDPKFDSFYSLVKDNMKK